MTEPGIGALAWLALQSGFDWEQGVVALMVTAVVMGGLVLVEAVHKPRRRDIGAVGEVPGAVTPARAGVKWGHALWAGLVATAAMSGSLAILAGAGWPRLDPAAALAGAMQVDLALGWIAHGAIGVMLAFIYAGAFANVGWGGPWLRGTAYGLLPFLAAQAIVSPLMGGGIFSTEMAQASGQSLSMILLVSLIGHLVYGAVLGWVYGQAPAADELA